MLLVLLVVGFVGCCCVIAVLNAFVWLLSCVVFGFFGCGMKRVYRMGFAGVCGVGWFLVVGVFYYF